MLEAYTYVCKQLSPSKSSLIGYSCIDQEQSSQAPGVVCMYVGIVFNYH